MFSDGGGWVSEVSEMVSDAGGRRVGAVVGRQGRGELHSPQHVPTKDRGAWRSVAGKWVSIGGQWVTRAGKINSGRGE